MLLCRNKKVLEWAVCDDVIFVIIQPNLGPFQSVGYQPNLGAIREDVVSTNQIWAHFNQYQPNLGAMT